MGFLDNMLKSQASQLPADWKILESSFPLEQIVEDSHCKPVAIFKHSISCGTSAMAKYHLEENWNLAASDLDFYYLDLINHRSVSNQVAETFGVIHQSPQIILIHQGKAVYHTSHHMISVEGLARALENV